MCLSNYLDQLLGHRNRTDHHAGILDELPGSLVSVLAGDCRRAPAVEAESGNAVRCAGTYLPTRRISSGILGLAYWSLGNVRVSAISDRSIRMRGLSLDMELVEVEPLLFAEIEGRLMVAFAEDDRGVIRSMYHDEFPAMAYERIRPTETPGFALGFVVFLAALAALAILR